MIKRSTRHSRFCVWSLFATCLLLGLAPGLVYAAGDPAADPLGTAQASVDGGLGLFTTYGPVLGSMYLLYQLASRLVAKYAGASWLAKGKRLAFVTGILGVAGATLQAQVTGASWNVIVLAAIAAAFKLLTPTIASVSAGSEPPPSSGDEVPSTSLPTVRLAGAGVKGEKLLPLILLVLVCGFVTSGCGPKSTALLHEALDCTTVARNDLVEALTPTAISAIQKIADLNGKVTTEALKSLFEKASLKSEAGVILACAEARAVERLTAWWASKAAVAGLQSVGTVRLDGPALRGALADQFPGVTFKTAP